MERKAVSGIMLTVLLIGMLTLAFNIQHVKASGTIYIRADGSIYPSSAPIQRNGDYYTLTGNITSAEGIIIERNNMTLNGVGYVLQGTGAANSIGIYVPGKNVTIRNMKIKTFAYGISLSGSNNSIIANNIIGNNWSGVLLIGYTSAHNRIVGNNLTDKYGIWINDAQSNIICKNYIKNCEYGIRLTASADNNVASENSVTNNRVGIIFGWDSSFNIISRNLIAKNGVGIKFYGQSEYNIISWNNITDNGCGAYFQESSANRLYHNSFINNTSQVNTSSSSINVWDDGYPSGGNYWNDYNGTDLYRDPYQNETGSDGIGDTPYIIYSNNIDHYPLMKPWTPTLPVITTTIDLNPDTLNLKSRGKWISCYIELPEGHSVSAIDVSSIELNGTISAELKPVGIGDYDNDTVPDLMVKFNRKMVSAFILLKDIKYGNVTLTISGQLRDGTSFEGSDVIRVKMPSDVNGDGKVTGLDIGIIGLALFTSPGDSRWNPNADLNGDGYVGGIDVGIAGLHLLSVR